MRTVALIQCRYNSTRLPKKALADICGRPMLARVVQRVRRAQEVDEVVVATGGGPANQPIYLACRAWQTPCYLGSEDDVLDRFYGAAKWKQADVVVRISGDCPLIEPSIVDTCVRAVRDGGYDYAANTTKEPQRYPDGTDTEALTLDVLERMWREAKLPSEREHPTTWLWRSHPDLFRCCHLFNPDDWSQYRWCVDNAADLEFVRAVYGEFGETAFDMHDIVALLKQRPDILAINAGGERNEGLRKSLEAEAMTIDLT